MYFYTKWNVSLSTLLYLVQFTLVGAVAPIVRVDKHTYLICLLSEILQYQKPKGKIDREEDLSKILKIIIEKVKHFINLTKGNFNIPAKFPKNVNIYLLHENHQFFFVNLMYKQCTARQPVLVLVDDAQNVDNLSWRFLCWLKEMKGVLIVLSSRPAAVEVPPCDYAEQYIDSSNIRVIDLGVLDTRHLPALACQIMDVVRIPSELEA